MFDFYAVMESLQNVSITENGAVGLKTSGRPLVDLNFAASSLRRMSESDIIRLWQDAWNDDRYLALRWLFFLRDVRGGLGERRSFRIIFTWLTANHPDLASRLVSAKANGEALIPFYGRWDDLACFYDSPLKDDVVRVVSAQLKEDLAACERNEAASLLAKWLPSVNTSSGETVKLAAKMAKSMKLSHKSYRKMLSRLRRYLDVTERKMTTNEWQEIDYSAVPSRAAMIYRDAFSRHDPDGWKAYIESVERGESKINASVTYPYEIYARVRTKMCEYWGVRALLGMDVSEPDDSVKPLEEMWKALPRESVDRRIIVVCDGSGSMLSPVSQQTTALDVANSLAIYFADMLPGEFAGKFITFSQTPQLLDVGRYDTLWDKARETLRHDEIANTNIEAVFDLILKTARTARATQEEVPETVLIISDMEFDCCARTNGVDRPDAALFDEIRQRFEEQGYKLPRLVFWNVASRTRTIPVAENELGVALVSGFSPNILSMITSEELDPYKCLADALNSPRYDPVSAAINGGAAPYCAKSRKLWRYGIL